MQKQFKLFNLTLTNSKITFDNILKNNNISLVDLAARIRVALRIIHKFHINKKRIIFVGNPLHVNKQLSKLFKKTKHLFIPRSAWIAGHTTNRFAVSSRYGNSKLFSILKLKKKSSLVVIIDQLLDSVALNEFHSTKIPIISLNSKFNMLDETSVVKIPVKMVAVRSDLSTFLFYSLLIKIFKRVCLKKHKHYYIKRLTKKSRLKNKKKTPFNKPYLKNKKKTPFNKPYLKNLNKYTKKSMRLFFYGKNKKLPTFILRRPPIKKVH